MELGTIQREIFVDASPEVVFEVVSNPEHIEKWWPDEAHFEPVAGSVGEIVFGVDADRVIESLTVVDVTPPRRFSFRWTNPADEPAGIGNSLLVTFELEASGGGTVLTMTESGFRELGWEAAVLEQRYDDHVSGWDHYLPRLQAAAVTAGARA